MPINTFLEKGFTKLHLGCGNKYLEGYINIDNFTKERTDLKEDFTLLNLPASTFMEIRLHNVFEHFQRHIAIKLLCDWNKALITGGQLIIEVPDIDACIKEFYETIDSNRKKELIRHMWGSHKEGWATHCEGWTQINLKEILSACGFTDFIITRKQQKWVDMQIQCKKSCPPEIKKILEFLQPFDAGNGILLPIWKNYFITQFKENLYADGSSIA